MASEEQEERHWRLLMRVTSNRFNVYISVMFTNSLDIARHYFIAN